MANCIRCGRQLPGFTFGKKICQWCVQHEKYQRGEIVEDAKQPVMRTPWVRSGESSIGLTQIIFGINVAVFLGMGLAGSTVMDFSPQETIRWGANWGPLTLSGEWWRLLTCVFVHGGIIATVLDEVMGKANRFRGVRAVTAKPGGATVQPSPCDIHTCWVAGSPSRSTPGSVTSSVVAPYSPPPVRATSPPRPAIMSWKP